MSAIGKEELLQRFDKLKLRRLEADVFKENKTLTKLLEKRGFKKRRDKNGGKQMQGKRKNS